MFRLINPSFDLRSGLKKVHSFIYKIPGLAWVWRHIGNETVSPAILSGKKGGSIISPVVQDGTP